MRFFERLELINKNSQNMNFLDKASQFSPKEKAQIKTMEYTIPTKVGEFTIKVDFIEKSIYVHLPKINQDMGEVKQSFDTIQQSLDETIAKGENYQYILSFNLHYLDKGYERKLKDSVMLKKELFNEPIDILFHNHSSLRPQMVLKSDESLKTIGDLLEKTEYAIINMKFSSESTLITIKEMLKKAGEAK